MSLSSLVIQQAEQVAREAKHVRVCEEAAERAAAMIIEGAAKTQFSLQNWQQHELHPKQPSDATLDWLFVLDSLNFSFWSGSSELFTVEHKGKQYTGYWSLVAAINRALDEGIPLTTPSYYATITDEQMAHIFRSASSEAAPLVAERAAVLRQSGLIMCERFGGSFLNCLKECKGSAQTLLSLVVENFPSFRDKAPYHDREVWILKRAQILIADIWGCYQGQGHGAFSNIHTLTMFADYRVPQALLYAGLLQYSPSLNETLVRGEVLSSGDEREVEIRACSIWAVEVLRRAIARTHPAASMWNAVMLDFYLWDFAKANSHALSALPIHRVRSIYY